MEQNCHNSFELSQVPSICTASPVSRLNGSRVQCFPAFPQFIVVVLLGRKAVIVFLFRNCLLRFARCRCRQFAICGLVRHPFASFAAHIRRVERRVLLLLFDDQRPARRSHLRGKILAYGRTTAILHRLQTYSAMLTSANGDSGKHKIPGPKKTRLN